MHTRCHSCYLVQSTHLSKLVSLRSVFLLLVKGGTIRTELEQKQC